MDNYILLGALQGKFFLSNKDVNINFNKNSQEIFQMVKDFNIEELWVITGPGSFIATRSVVAFVLGYTFNTSITLKGFNILLDLIPIMSSTKDRNKLYIFNELNRFFYCIYEKDLLKRDFFLLSSEELEIHKNNYYLVGNHEIAHEIININPCILYEIILANKNKILTFERITLEYCGKFLI
jgi:hypothetical protein